MRTHLYDIGDFLFAALNVSSVLTQRLLLIVREALDANNSMRCRNEESDGRRADKAGGGCNSCLW